LSRMTDQEYLLSKQYRDEANLDARKALHRRFSTNPTGWFRWLFDQLDLSARSQMLEVGCGPGDLWLENLERIPTGWHVTLSDFSPGMVQKAQENLRQYSRGFAFRIIDAQSIPCEDERFDAVLANHMLYHVPDREKALSEIKRVLKPHGRVYASTVGRAHLLELHDLVRQVSPTAFFGNENPCEPFLLDNGEAQLSRWFVGVKLRRYEDDLVITEAAPLIAYVLSTTARADLSCDKLTALRRLVERRLCYRGAIRVTKDSGLFEAIRDAGQSPADGRLVRE